MPDTLPPYNWRSPLGGDFLKSGFQAMRDLATDIAATITARTTVTCTSTTRPASPTDGMRIWETDTKATGFWDASGTGHWIMYDTQWQTRTPVLATGVYSNSMVAGNSTAIGRFYRKGREISYEGIITLGSTAAFQSSNYGTIMVDYPAGLGPYTWSTTSTIPPAIGQAWIYYGGGTSYGFVTEGTPGSVAAQRRLVFYNTAGLAATGTANNPAGWYMSSPTHACQWSCTYETAFEA